MKKGNYALVSVLFLLGIIFMACNNDDSPTGKPGLISSNISSCKNDPSDQSISTRGDGDNGDMIHHLEYEVDGDGQLHLKDANHWVPCSMTAFEVDAVVNGDTIMIKEEPVTGDVVSTCICPIDIDLVIGPLENRTYTLIYNVKWRVPEKITINCRPGEKGSYKVLNKYMSKFDMEVDGIYYNIISAEERTVEVTNYPYEGGPGYEGDIVIPEQITHDGKTYTITSIGQGVFGGTSKINSVYLPNTIKEINGLGVFIDCINLTSVHLSEIITKIPDLTFSGCTGLTEIMIPEGVTNISLAAFYDCSSLKEITLPENLSAIGPNAFYGCTNLDKIISLNRTAPQVENNIAFNEEVMQTATLYVPKGSKEAYSTAECWKDFVHIEEYE
jgi:hypothetical protein